MNVGPAEDRDDHRDQRGDEDSVPLARQFRRDDLESHRAGALHEHHVARPEQPRAQPRRRPSARASRPSSPAVARARARRPRSPARRRARARAAPISAVVRRPPPAPSSAMSPSTATRRRPCRALGEVLERGAHRDRVRVVAVVDQQPAAGELQLLLAELRELDLQLAVLERRRRALRRDERGEGVSELVRASRTSRRERQAARSGVDAADLDVVARRYGSSSGSSGTIAMPPGGSASISSALARATFATVPTSSRCTGPMFVITPTSGRVNEASHAIWPRPRMPISLMQTSVSSSIRQSVSGTPSSLL